MTDYADVMDLEDCQGEKVPHIVGNTYSEAKMTALTWTTAMHGSSAT